MALVRLFLVLLVAQAWGQCPSPIVHPVLRVTPGQTSPCTVGSMHTAGHAHVTHRLTHGEGVVVQDDARLIAVFASNGTFLDRSESILVSHAIDVNLTNTYLTAVLGSETVLMENCAGCFVVNADQTRLTGQGQTWSSGLFIQGEGHTLRGGDMHDVFLVGTDFTLTTSGWGDAIDKVLVTGIHHRILLTSTSGTTYVLAVVLLGGTDHTIRVGERGISLSHIFGGANHEMSTAGAPTLSMAMTGNTMLGGASHQVRTNTSARAAPTWNTLVGGVESIVETLGTGNVTFNVMVGGGQHRMRGSLTGTTFMRFNGIFAGKENIFDMTSVTGGLQSECVMLGGDKHRMYGLAARNGMLAGRGGTIQGAADCAMVAGVSGRISNGVYSGSLNENGVFAGNAVEIGLRGSGNDVYRCGTLGGNNNAILSPTSPQGLMESDGIVAGRLIKIQGGSFTGTLAGERNTASASDHAAIVAGSDGLIDQGSDGSVLLGGGRRYNGNTISDAKRGGILGGQGHTIPSGVDDAVILGGQNVTAFAPGATMSAAWIASGAASFGAPSGGLVRQGSYSTAYVTPITLTPLQVIQGYTLSVAVNPGPMVINLPAASTYAASLSAMGIVVTQGMRLTPLLFNCRFGSAAGLSVVSPAADMVQTTTGAVTTNTVSCGVDEVCRLTPVFTGPTTMLYFYEMM